MRRKRVTALLMAAVLSMGALGGCGQDNETQEGQAVQVQEEEEAEMQEGQETEADADEGKDMADTAAIVLPEGGQAFGEGMAQSIEIDVTPAVEPYAIEPDLSNIDNLWQFYLEDGIQDKLAQNGFVVCGSAGDEFFSAYEENRYCDVPNFVTVDSLMHTYHLYFSYLLKKVEKNSLLDNVRQLGARMLDNSIEAYECLEGSEWESAAKRNVAFFAVGAKLLDSQADTPDYVEETVSAELGHIVEAGDVYPSEITGRMEDYTQYIPRGYYEGDEELEAYFRAMMWYGRIHFEQDDEDLDRSALLISKMLSEDEAAYQLWESVYSVTSFFTGASDDAGVYEYIPAMEEAYGAGVKTEDLVGNEEAFGRFHAMTAKLRAPQVNSIPIGDGEDNVIPGFRFMGQRFTVDAAIMQKLIYSDVKENSAKEKRMLPDVLDVPAALGSDTALGILDEQGATDFQGYSEHMEQLRTYLAKDNDSLWSASLYAGWLNTLRPLLDVKGEGYPVFMQGEEWAKKNLECFAGSFAELKHDTILYSKQVMAEMGGGYEQEPDDRGYVEPEPLVYARFAVLSEMTAQGLKQYGMLDGAEEENLSRLTEMAARLSEISKKELEEEEVTEDEFEFIRGYGGNLEHFWYEALKDGEAFDEPNAIACPSALVADIATDPNGTVLEVATGNSSIIYVVVKVAGKVKIAKGSVYSFYQFAWPMSDRLTDSRWHQMIGAAPNDEGNYVNEGLVQKPAWTESYRYRYEWE